MAVHLPLSIEAQVEAHVLMMSHQQHLQPGQRQPDHQPSQDIVMGCYYLTVHRRGEPGEYKTRTAIEMASSATPDEVFLAFSQKQGRRPRA